MADVSSPSRKITWQDGHKAANLLAALASEQTRIAERLARLREAHALTQEAAAARAGVTLRQWQRWESGESEPYARNIAKISEEFSIPLGELVGEPTLEPTQLDRLESKLDLALIALAEVTGAEMTRRLERAAAETAVQLGVQPIADDEQPAATPRRQARQRTR